MANSLTISTKQMVVETLEEGLIELKSIVKLAPEDHETHIKLFELTRPGKTYSNAEIHLIRDAFASHIIAIQKAHVEIN